jgi:hypothetical protein
MNAITAFLNGKTLQLIYVELPDGYYLVGTIGMLLQTIYRLKQSSCLWQETLCEQLLKMGFYLLKSDDCLYITNKGIYSIMVFTYVNDFLIAGCDCKEVDAFKAELSKVFSITDLGPCTTFLGISLVCDCKNCKMHLSQAHYAEKLIHAFGLQDAKPVWTPIEVSALNDLIPYSGTATKAEIN